jgi:hypothetical protein
VLQIFYLQAFGVQENIIYVGLVIIDDIYCGRKKSYMTIPENTYEDMNLPYDGGLDGYI